MPRRRTALLQSEQPYVPDREGVASMEAVYCDGIDAGYNHRAEVRALNKARQDADRRAEKMREPTLFSEAWLADQVRKSELSGMRMRNQALIAESMARKRARAAEEERGAVWRQP